MKRSLARSLLLTFTFCAVALTIAPLASAFKLKELNMRVLHGNYAFGYAGPLERAAILNIKTGKLRILPVPPDSTNFVPSKASDVAMVGVTENSAEFMNPQYLYRYNNRTGSRQLLDQIPRGEDWCRDQIVPVSISDDGTVIAQFLTYVPGPNWCLIDASRSFLRQYAPGSGMGKEVWLPAKYRPWLAEGTLDANENTLAIATRGGSGGPGEIAVIDIAKKTVLAERQAANVGSLSLANPRSLYVAQTREPQQIVTAATGTMKYWRIGDGKPRTLFRGQVSPQQSTNCGNRALVVSNRRLWIIDRKGNISFKRRVGPNHSIGLPVCSADNLHYLDVELEMDGPSSYPFVKHVLNISRLP